ncbi:DUF1460 domain-containing protein [candidate division KSB1 bacterium]|nr:DUF1460 domain-containing protein [candidate division KSB1 bacterium]
MRQLVQVRSALLAAMLGAAAALYGQNVFPPMTPRAAFKTLGVFKPSYFVHNAKPASSNGAAGVKLLPYRSLAVNPTKILLGSVLFVPQAYGVALPSGEIHDGFFFAQEARRACADTLALFVGNETRSENAFTRNAAFRSKPVLEVYIVSEPVAGALRRRYREEFETKPKPALNEMLAQDIDTLLREVSAKEANTIARLAIYSEQAKGTPYSLFCLGEGPTAKYDRDPLLDFSRADCMTFVEQMLAMSISSNYDEMFANLLRIRYKNGEIGFTTRNHYTHADWLPNNGWLLEDVSAELGGALCADMTKVIDRPGFFRKLGVPERELQGIPAPQPMTVKYIPTANLPKIKDRLQGGEIVSLIQKMPGIFSAHMGFVIRDQYGNVLFRHASARKETRQVTDEFFDDVIEQLSASASRVGMAFFRIKTQVK